MLGYRVILWNLRFIIVILKKESLFFTVAAADFS